MLDFGFYNMDCMDGMKCFPDKYFELAIVDPVYGDVTGGGYTTGKNEKKAFRIGNNAADQKAYNRAVFKQPKTSKKYFDELFRVSKNQIIWGGNFFVDSIPSSQGWIVWDKGKPDGVTFSDCELAFTSFNCRLRIFRYMWHGMLQEDMKNKEFRIHPTQKPVALYEWILNNYAQEGDKILDTHVGSASSLIACHELGFQYVGFEIDPDYYATAKARLDTESAQYSLFDCNS